MTGVQTCALPICFPVTISRSLNYHTPVPQGLSFTLHHDSGVSPIYVDSRYGSVGGTMYPEDGFIKALQYGYMMELEETYNLILEWLNDNTDEE